GGCLRASPTDQTSRTSCSNLRLAWWPAEPRIEASKTFRLSRSHLMRLCRLLAFAVLMLSQLDAAAAQEWPTRYITAIVPFGPGNSVDIVGRLLVGRMSELLGQQIIVENIGGTGGSIGTARAARAAPDGYTIVIGAADTFAQNQSLFEKPPY